MKHKHISEKKIIGWREFIDLPEWGIRNIRAKVDTGARTSSLHVEDITHLHHNHIEFYIVTKNSHPRRRKKVHARILKKGRVRSSTGHGTERLYVKTIIQIGDYRHEIPLNLVNRRDMNFRMLLGRTAIEDFYLVDVDRSFLLSRKEKDKH